MPSDVLRITYRLNGFDQPLYSNPAIWPQASFVQHPDHSADLVLEQAGIDDADTLKLALATLAERAEKFRLSAMRLAARVIVMQTVSIEAPDFTPPGELSARATITARAEASLTVGRTAPPQIPQTPHAARSWIEWMALAQAAKSPSDQLKNLYTVIEDLMPRYVATLDAQQTGVADTARLLRNFVSHPFCRDPAVVQFVAAHLPGAIVQGASGPEARFDGQNVAHQNFVGQYAADIRRLAQTLMDRAIAALP